MIETKLTDLLERTADQTPVGPPPLNALRTGAAHRRHRRTAGLAAAAAVAVVIGATSLLTSHRSTVTSPAPAPVATRLVGFGHAVIAVPKAWGRNQSMCGTAMADTVLIDDPSAFHLCAAFQRSGVESVQISGRPTIGFRADETLTIDGVLAERQRTTCVAASNGVAVCSGAVSIPTLGVWFRAESSTNADEVGRILDRIAVVTDQSGVPGYLTVGGSVQGALAANYAPLLEKAGLKPRYVMKKSPNYPAGLLLAVMPAAGTMLKPGATVTVTVTG
jgi:hypothetical protein